MDRETAYRIDQMAQDGVLYSLDKQQLTELMGSPTWRYADSIVWDLHPHIWEGRVTLYLATGEVVYSYDQGSAL